MALTQVFEPIRLGPVEVPNRIVRTAHDSGLAFMDINDDYINYHLARARGGCGLTILEASSVHPSSQLHVALWRDSIIPGFEKLMDAVRPHGMKVFQQLWHGGNIYPDSTFGPAWAVSDKPGFLGLVGRPMTTDDVLELKQAFVDAALRCQKGGLDGVEIHACHGYVIHQFLNPYYNDRSDQYGGSFENRSRFLFEVAREIRAAVRPDFAVGIRLGVSEMPGGVDDEINKTILLQLQDEKLIDFVDLSMGDYFKYDTVVGGMHYPTGYQQQPNAATCEAATVPRIIAGRFRTLEEAEQVIRDGQAELVSMVRAQIADPDLVNKTRLLGAEAVRPCIGCNQGCIGGLFRANRMGCAVNPAVGYEAVMAEELIEPTTNPRKVLIVGGGPAGMEAARIAATIGHKVVLAEAQPNLGGTVNIAKTAPYLSGIGDISFWLEQEVYRLGVEVRLGTYMDADDILAEGADDVIIATGSLPRMDGFQYTHPGVEVAGVGQPHVLSSIDLLSDPGTMRGKHALVLDTTGQYEALAATEFLLKQGVAVTFISCESMVGRQADAAFHRQLVALERFYKLGTINILLRHILLEIREKDCVVRPIEASLNQTAIVPADTVVLVTQNMPLRQLHDELRARGVASQLVGDALVPRDVQVAIAEGHRAGRALV